MPAGKSAGEKKEKDGESKSLIQSLAFICSNVFSIFENNIADMESSLFRIQ